MGLIMQPLLLAMLAVMLLGACASGEQNGVLQEEVATPMATPPSPMPAPSAPRQPGFTPSSEPWRPLPLPTATAEERAAASDTLLYLTAFQNDHVIVIDPVSGHALHQLSADADQAGMAISPDGSRLYVVDGLPTVDGRLSVFDTATWEVVHLEPVPHRLRLLGGNPIALSPDGRWLVVGFFDLEGRLGWERVFDTERLRFLPEGAWPLSDCRLSPLRFLGRPADSRFYVPCTGFVAALDSEDLTPLWRAPSPSVGGVSQHLASSPDGERLYGLFPHVEGEVRSDGNYHVTEHDLRLLVWEADSGVLVDEIRLSDLASVPPPTPGRGDAGYVTVSFVGERVFIVWEDMLWAINAEALEVAGELRLPSPVDGVAQSIDGRELYLLPATMGNLEVEGHGMYTVDAATLELLRHADDWPKLRLPFFFSAPPPVAR